VARLLIGASNRWILPLSATLGGLFLLISDGLARTLTASEIPLGVVTELLGAIAFLFLIGRIRQGA
ncbi:MAG: iron chelate uptake ABC transporter family permease subunit, partial [Enterobacterales bacterium]|nr:iron chelate uptake ABC transporter family permease subunit [Enterobacterales bacterium]MDN6114521.1 iron chelate uptake ABC transporter family permease subunit [Enterobacterales bacterium]